MTTIPSFYGAGGIVGYNGAGGQVVNASFSGAGVLRFEPTTLVAGGVVGINLGIIDNATVPSYQFSAPKSTYAGGIYGVVAAYNAGTIRSTTINRPITAGMSNAGYVFDAFTQVGTRFDASANTNTAYTGSDTSSNYMGGIAGFNAAAGVIQGCRFTGKIVLDRKTGNVAVSRVFMGGIAGFNLGSITGSTADGINLVSFNYIWVDDGAARPEHFFGGISGNVNNDAGNTNERNRIDAAYRGAGRYYTGGSSGFIGIGGGDAANYRTTRVLHRVHGGMTTNSVVRHTHQHIPSQLWNTQGGTLWWRYNEYTLFLRQVHLDT